MEAVQISADLCPRISQEFLREERKALGQHWFEQEYLCKWHESETSLFRAEVIQRAIRDFDELDITLNEDEHAGLEEDGFEPDW